MSLLMLTKLMQQPLTPLSPVFFFFSPGGPFQWCVAVSNFVQAKSMQPKSSIPKSSRPEVRVKNKAIKYSVHFQEFGEAEASFHRHVYVLDLKGSH